MSPLNDNLCRLRVADFQHQVQQQGFANSNLYFFFPMLIYRIEEAKRAIKRPSDDRYDDSDRKRSTTDRRFEAPPPPRFDSSTISSRSGYDRSSDKKRDDYKSSYDRSSSSSYSKDSRSGGDSRTTKSRYEAYDSRSAPSNVWSQPAAVSYTQPIFSVIVQVLNTFYFTASNIHGNAGSSRNPGQQLAYN